MAGERTLYRKLQVILDYAKEGKHSDIGTLVAYVLKHKPTNFIYYYRDRSTDEVKRGYSESSVERTIEVLTDLMLLSPGDLSLTKRGVAATDPGRFPGIVGKGVTRFLEGRGIPLESILETIKVILRAESPRPPTATEIWEKLGLPEDSEESEDSIDAKAFRQMMSLLGQCEVIYMTQRRIYLPLTE